MEDDISILTDLADYVHEPDNMVASISSGSYWTDGMIVAPCSMKSLAGIVTGYTDNLLLRAVDVRLYHQYSAFIAINKRWKIN